MKSTVSAIMSAVLLLTALCIAHGAVTHPAHLQVKQATAEGNHGKIHPELDPVSDNKFFKADYTDDDRGTKVFHHFDHPFPTVQDSERYDKDYVEDKNDDNGYWNAQMKYDGLKNKLMKEQSELKEALASEQEESRHLKEAIAAEKAAEKASLEAEKRQKAADKDHDGAADKLSSVANSIDKAAESVEGEVTDIEECKKQLEAARKKLKSLLEEKALAKAKQQEKEKLEENAEALEISAEKAEELAEANVEKEKKEHEAAVEKYDKELADMKKAEADLQVAALNLRKFRHADPDGGVYEVKSGATGTAGLPAAALLVMGLVQCLP